MPIGVSLPTTLVGDTIWFKYKRNFGTAAPVRGGLTTIGRRCMVLPGMRVRAGCGSRPTRSTDFLLTNSGV